MPKYLKESFAVCFNVVCYDIVERALYRLSLLQGRKMEDLLIDEVYDI